MRTPCDVFFHAFTQETKFFVVGPVENGIDAVFQLERMTASPCFIRDFFEEEPIVRDRPSDASSFAERALECDERMVDSSLYFSEFSHVFSP